MQPNFADFNTTHIYEKLKDLSKRRNDYSVAYLNLVFKKMRLDPDIMFRFLEQIDVLKKKTFCTINIDRIEELQLMKEYLKQYEEDFHEFYKTMELDEESEEELDIDDMEE